MEQLKGKIFVYSVVGCPYCIRAKGFLDAKNLPYIDVNVDQNAEARKMLLERTGRKTVPQIFFNEKHIGGWDDLQKIPQEDFEKLVQMVKENGLPAGLPVYVTGGDVADSFEFQCELDEYGVLVQELKKSGLVKDQKRGLWTYKNAFVGREAVDWLVHRKNLDRDAAVEMLRQIVERHFGHGVKRTDVSFQDDTSVYRFIEDDEGNALNGDVQSQCEPRPGCKEKKLSHMCHGPFLGWLLLFLDLVFGLWRFLRWQRFFLYVILNADVPLREERSYCPMSRASELGEELRQLILNIYSSHLSKDGKEVDYQSIASDANFSKYLQRTAELRRVKVESATREEKLAFFINIYNALVIHAFVEVGPPTSLWQRYKFFNTVSYIIGGYTYSLNDIENGILRANRKAIGAIKKPFRKSDPRLKISLKEPEPRIHFALVCGAKSCPPIKTYSASDIDNQLQLAAESFLEGDGVAVDIKKREVRVSQILKWYKEDFGRNKEEIACYLLDHMGPCQKKTQLQLLVSSGNFRLSHIPYDWSLNSK